MNNKINKVLTFLVLLISLSLLNFSCAFVVEPQKEYDNKGSLTFNIPRIQEIRSLRNITTEEIDISIKIKSKNGSYKAEKIVKTGSNTEINDLKPDTYIVSVSGEDNRYSYYAEEQTVEVKAKKSTELKFDILYKLKGGQIALLFKECNFDTNAYFNVIVKDKNNKEIF